MTEEQRGFELDFALNDEQREWQMKARAFAKDEIRPISLARDDIPDPRETFEDRKSVV